MRPNQHWRETGWCAGQATARDHFETPIHQANTLPQPLLQPDRSRSHPAEQARARQLIAAARNIASLVASLASGA